MLYARIRNALVLVLSTAAVSAGVLAQPGEAGPGRIYRLDADASYQQGCFDPCDCPLGEPVVTRGAFVLGPPIPGNVVDFHRVTQIFWTVGDPLDTLHTLTGTGTYRLTNYGPPQSHSLDLTLSVDGGEPQHFFSDFVPADNGAESLQIPVSLNGVFCKDTVIRVNATPAPVDDVVRYSLTSDSMFQQGCFDPCDCLLEEPRPMVGAFDLVPLVDLGTLAEFAVVRAHFLVPPGAGVRLVRFSGFGRYTLVQGFAGPADTMALNLRSGSVVRRFDSTLRNTDAAFPTVSVAVDMNDMVCFDKVLTIDAAPIDLTP